MATCSSCGADLIFVKSVTTGKPMPLDAKPMKRIVLVDLVGGLDHKDGSCGRVVDTYLSHFVSCPDAVQHRKP